MDERYLNRGLVPPGPAHNMVFLIYCANMDGQRSVAYEYSDTLRQYYLSAPDRMDGPGPEQGFQNALTARLRFKDWAGVIADNVSTPRVWPYAHVLKAMARGLAFVKMAQYSNAIQEYLNLQASMSTVSNLYQRYALVANWTLAASLAWFDHPARPAEAIATLAMAVQQQTSWYVCVCVYVCVFDGFPSGGITSRRLSHSRSCSASDSATLVSKIGRPPMGPFAPISSFILTMPILCSDY